MGEKNEYDNVKELALKYGFTQQNSSLLSLLMPPGNTWDKARIIKMVDKLLGTLDKTYFVCVESTIDDSDLYLRAGFNRYSDLMPFNHVHILIKEEKFEVRNLKARWFELLATKSKKRLFHCTYLDKPITSCINYITKYREESREAICHNKNVIASGTKIKPKGGFSRFMSQIKAIIKPVLKQIVSFGLVVVISLAVSVYDESSLAEYKNNPP